MDKSTARTALLTSAMIVAGMRMWMQVRGKTKTPFPEWAIGWGATFFTLALLSELSPTAAGSMSLVIAGADFLNNGISLTKDINNLVTNAETGNTGSVFVPQPFADMGNSGTVTSATHSAPTHVGTHPGRVKLPTFTG